MERELAKKFALLLSRASVLLKLGRAKDMAGHCYTYYMGFHLALGARDGWETITCDVDRDEHPYDENAINAALARMDALIAQTRKEAEDALEVIDSMEA